MMCLDDVRRYGITAWHVIMYVLLHISRYGSIYALSTVEK